MVVESLTNRIFSTLAKLVRSHQGKTGLLLIGGGVVLLFGVPAYEKQLRTWEFSTSQNNVAKGESTGNPRPTQGNRQPKSINSDEGPARLGRFLIGVLPWVLGGWLAAQFGPFNFIRKGGKLLLILLGTIALVLFGDGISRTLGLALPDGVQILIPVVAVVLWFGLSLWVLLHQTTARKKPGTAPEVRQRDRGVGLVNYSAVGGMEAAKAEIRKLVRSRLDAKRYRKYGVVQNGILLHGPRGSGKTLLAEATAGEFGLHYEYVSPTSLKDMWVGSTEANIRRLFESAAARPPVLLFIDEVDGLGGARQVLTSDPGGGRKAHNDAVVQLMQCIDQYRSLPGFVLMAATNLLDGLDPALIREGRFDLKIRVDLPDEAARRNILESLLSGKPSSASDLNGLAARTPGFSAAKLRAVVDRAAVIAADNRRKIEGQDLNAALEAMGGKDRPLLEPVEWRDVVIDTETEEELQELIGLLNDPGSGRQWKIHPPSGVLLVGAPGTGKSLLVRLVATQTRRSLYPITPSDVLGGQVGESVKKLSGVFERAKENRPSMIFFDEIDGLLPRTDGALISQHDVQLVEQCLTEISNLSPQADVFLIGTTNHLDRIDPRALRGGRFSEKIQISLPSLELRQRLFGRLLEALPLAPEVTFSWLAHFSEGLSQADVQAVCEAAKRFAHRRARDGQKSVLMAEDFHKAMERIRVTIFPSSYKTAVTGGE